MMIAILVLQIVTILVLAGILAALIVAWRGTAVPEQPIPPAPRVPDPLAVELVQQALRAHRERERGRRDSPGRMLLRERLKHHGD
jgi:hypothetical protein